MPKFSANSERRLATCDTALQELFNEVIKHYDCSILCGYRNQAEQEIAFNLKHSMKHYPDSKHNSFPSKAVDAAPYPLDWKDEGSFYHFAGFVQAVANSMGIRIRFGGDWNQNLKFKEEKLRDLVHFELMD